MYKDTDTDTDMSNMIITQFMEVKRYLDLLQEQYADAFRDLDTEGMIETSNDLSLAYFVLGYESLAYKWREAYWEHLSYRETVSSGQH